MKHARVVIAAAYFGLMVSPQGRAQQSKTGQISGHVVDSVGASIKDASVFIRRNTPSEDNVRLAAHTDIHGDFVLVLPEGGYDVLVTSPGFAAQVETVPISFGKPKKAQWKLGFLGCDFPGINCDTFR
jgi:hypothetical protein